MGPKTSPPAEAVITVASLCLSLTIAIVLTKGKFAQLYHLSEY